VKIVAALGVTTTEFTPGGVMVSVVEPDTPSMVAVTLATPGATPDTRPPCVIVAIDAGPAVQVVGPRPLSTTPWASRAAAVADVEAPTSIDVTPIVTVTVATGAGGGGGGGGAGGEVPSVLPHAIEAAAKRTIKRRMGPTLIGDKFDR
jgi:hypothetical protein